MDWSTFFLGFAVCFVVMVLPGLYLAARWLVKLAQSFGQGR